MSENARGVGMILKERERIAHENGYAELTPGPRASAEIWRLHYEAQKAETVAAWAEADRRGALLKAERFRINAALELIGKEGCDCGAFPGDEHTCFAGRMERALQGARCAGPSTPPPASAPSGRGGVVS